jgi:hypothetical protein
MIASAAAACSAAGGMKTNGRIPTRAIPLTTGELAKESFPMSCGIIAA